MARRKTFRSFVKQDSGATAVEFSLIAGPFFWFFLSMFETGLMLFTDYALQAGVQAAARTVRTGQMQTGTLSANFQSMNFRQIVCKQAAIIANCEAKVSIKVQSTTGTLTSFKSTIPDVLAIGPNAAGTASYECNPGKPLDNVAVIATYDWQYFLPFMSPFANLNGAAKPTRRLVGYAMFQNEPFTTQGSIPTC